MQRIEWSAATAADRERVLSRPVEARAPRVAERVREILADVSTGGASAVDAWAVRLDGSPMRRVEITDEGVAQARRQVAPDDLSALMLASRSIRVFHEAERPKDGAEIESLPGVFSRRVWRPLDSAGLYIPGGGAPLFSTLLMLAIPAQVAGVRRVVAVTPPQGGGDVHPMMVLAAREAGLDALWLVGGAQAVAALALGAGLARVDKIFGPGNAWVAEAKRQAAELPGGPALDLPAGPSELLIIADHEASPRVVAADLLGQAEHDADAQVLLVTPSPELADAVAVELQTQLDALPRAVVARASLARGAVIVCSDLEQAVEIANAYAPEHLSLQVREADALVGAVRHAGAVFVSDAAAESFGDYLAGPSHVLPTGGAARAFSGVTTAAFMKSFTLQRIAPHALAEMASAAARLARLEGLEAHALAAEARIAGALR